MSLPSPASGGADSLNTLPGSKDHSSGASNSNLYTLEELRMLQKDKKEATDLIHATYEAHSARLEAAKDTTDVLCLESGSLSPTQYNLASGLSDDFKNILSISDLPSGARSGCPSLTLQIGLNPATSLNKKIPSQYFKGYHHATWYVSNAKQAAKYFAHCLGFEYIAYKGLETGSKLTASHVVKNGNVVFEFLCPLMASSEDPEGDNTVQSVHSFIQRHGDGVKDVCFEVDKVEYVYESAVSAGATPVRSPCVMSDKHGSVKVATIEVFDDVHHTLVELQDYTGPFLPGYEDPKIFQKDNSSDEFIIRHLPKVALDKIDHCVQNEDWDKLEEACDVYKRIFGFHEFWSVDENDVSTEYSALRSIVMTSANEQVKMPLNEPAEGICKSQIEEFLDFYNGPGVQHIALLTSDIISAVRHMKMRGTEFITVPHMYYENLLPRLIKTGIDIKEDLKQLQELDILIDFDEQGYLLQIFTKPLTDRPTFFLEVIQRHNHNGFGKGNFKALFETIEGEQRLRGTLQKSTKM